MKARNIQGRTTLLEIAAAVLVAVIGTYLLSRGMAAMPDTAIEPEAGISSSSSAAITDGSASGGKAIRFGERLADISGVAMPASAPTGWSRVFADNFKDPIPAGKFPQQVSKRWGTYNGYKDTSGNGYYNDDIVSVSQGALRMQLQSISGVPQSAAPYPRIHSNGSFGGMAYGRYSVRFKVDSSLGGWAAAWLLFSDTNTWNDGEIDFPEGRLGSTIKGFNHCPGNPSNNCQSIDTSVLFASGWHTTTIEWKPDSLKYILDGTTVLNATKNIPQKSMHFVLQTETAYGSIPPPTASGTITIDWITVDSLDI